MNDSECVRFLQWALPQLHMRWPGFRRVRNQVCKRLQRRIKQLQLADSDAYQAYLLQHPDEWRQLDGFCQVTVSRFYRDKAVFAFLQEQVFPHLISQARHRGDAQMHIWSAGCGAGEEPYTLALLWALCFEDSYPELAVQILGTDINPVMLARAREAYYPYSAIKNLPSAWRAVAFDQDNQGYQLRSGFRKRVAFACQDLRAELPVLVGQKPFDLICCRNLAFTYFDEALQRKTVQRLHSHMVDSGVLLIGVHEAVPENIKGFRPWSQRLGIYQRL